MFKNALSILSPAWKSSFWTSLSLHKRWLLRTSNLLLIGDNIALAPKTITCWMNIFDDDTVQINWLNLVEILPGVVQILAFQSLLCSMLPLKIWTFWFCPAGSKEPIHQVCQEAKRLQLQQFLPSPSAPLPLHWMCNLWARQPFHFRNSYLIKSLLLQNLLYAFLWSDVFICVLYFTSLGQKLCKS